VQPLKVKACRPEWHEGKGLYDPRH
jgi:hypothetical protein